jgi:hypothetical protein
LIGGFRLADRRPILAGVLFGLASVRPQFGLLVPIALIASRLWKCLIAATVTVLVGVGASALTFGWRSWAGLPAAMANVSRFVARVGLLRVDPTIPPMLHSLGLPAAAAIGIEVMVAIAVSGTIWRLFRRGVFPPGVAALMAGTFLVTPYAVFYDVPIATYALLVVVSQRRQSACDFTGLEAMVLALIAILPLLLFLAPLPFAWGGIGPAALLFLILRQIRTIPRSALPHPAGSPPPPASAAVLASS